MPFPNIGPGELILILIIALVVLGPSRLPDVASSLGKSIREFRKAATDVADAGKIDAPSTTGAQASATPPPNTTTTAPSTPSVPASATDPNTLAATPEPNRLAEPAPSNAEPAAARDSNVS